MIHQGRGAPETDLEVLLAGLDAQGRGQVGLPVMESFP